MQVVIHSYPQFAGGRVVILSPQMDRKNPGAICKATGNVVWVCVYMVFCPVSGHLKYTPPLLYNKCHPCMPGPPSKWSDQWHKYTKTWLGRNKYLCDKIIFSLPSISLGNKLSHSTNYNVIIHTIWNKFKQHEIFMKCLVDKLSRFFRLRTANKL